VGVKKIETNLKKRNKIAIAKKLRVHSTDTEKTPHWQINS